MKMHTRISALALNISVLSLGGALSHVAYAQEEGARVRPTLEEVIVTAQKRDETALTVPITISAISSSQLEAQGISSSAALATAVPGLQMNRSINAATPFIRGVGNPSGAVGEEGATAVYVDGAYNSNQYANLFELNNIDHIEVLKGPQGTLFGRNSAAGAILITTKLPTHDFALDASIGYGNYDTKTGSLYLNGEVTENLAANLALQGRDQGEGYGRNLTLDKDTGLSRMFSIRNRWLWDSQSGTTVTLSGDYYRSKDFLAGHPMVLNALGFGDPGFYNSLNNQDTSMDVTNYGVSLRVEHEFDPFQLVSMTAYRNTKTTTMYDFDATPLNIVAFAPLKPEDESWTQELQFVSNADSTFDWVAGLFYFHDRAGYFPYYQVGIGTGTPTVGTGDAYFNMRDHQTTDSYAGFVQATFPVNWLWEDTNLTVGGRYSVDNRELDYVRDSNVPARVLPHTKDDVSYYSDTWRISLDHQFSPDTMAYISFNTGFKSGLYNLNTPNDPPVEPETVQAYETGLKTRLFDGQVQFESAFFYNEFDDIQLRKITAGGGTVLLNAASAKLYGLDININAQATERLTVGAAMEWLSSEFTEFPDAPYTIPRPAAVLPNNACPPGGTTGAPIGGNIACAADASGNDMIQAPPFTGSLTLTYTMPIGEYGTVIFNGAYSYNDGFYWEPDNRLKQSAYDIVNGSIAWQLPGDVWQVKLWGQNLTDTEYSSVQVSSTTGDNLTGAPPRTYGVTVSAKFGN